MLIKIHSRVKSQITIIQETAMLKYLVFFLGVFKVKESRSPGEDRNLNENLPKYLETMKQALQVEKLN